MKVSIVSGAAPRTCWCGSWLEHWKKFGKQYLPNYCPVASCLQKPEIGTHVQKDDPSDRRWYIVPLCTTHSEQKGETLVISNTIALVPANVDDTCGKKEIAAELARGGPGQAQEGSGA